MNPVVDLVQKLGVVEAAKRLEVPVAELSEHLLTLHDRQDPVAFARENLKIRTKEGRITFLSHTTGQLKIQAAIERQRSAGRPVRIKNLKARQYGGSTKIQSVMFQDVIQAANKQYLTVCHDLDSARNMRAMFERFYNGYARNKPRIKKVSDKWWKFPEKDSDYLIDTADELDTGRSFTIHRAHISEVAFYRDPETLMIGLLQAVPEDSDSMVFIESTANGVGDWFYNFIHNDNGYDLVFVGWFEVPEYTRVFENESQIAEFERSLSSYEKLLIDRKHVSLEQLNWRRHTIESKLNGDDGLFQQEYPATPEEAFITSGRPFFKTTVVMNENLRTEKLKPRTGYLEWVDYGKRVQFTEDRNGWWKVFSEPEEGWEYRYVTGSDTAEGKTVSEARKDPDNSSCRVFDRTNNTESAAFCARIDTDLFGVEIFKAVTWYRSACDCVERNGPGIAVIDFLKTKEVVNLYRRELMGKVDDQETVEYGFQTNQASRDSLLTNLKTRVREGTYKSDDNEFWKECLAFVYDDKGKPCAQRGAHDDRVLAAALAIEAASQANELHPIVRPEEAKKHAPDADIWSEEEEKESVRTEF